MLDTRLLCLYCPNMTTRAPHPLIAAAIEESRQRLAAQVADDACHCARCGDEIATADEYCEPCAEENAHDRAVEHEIDCAREGDR